MTPVMILLAAAVLAVPTAEARRRLGLNAQAGWSRRAQSSTSRLPRWLFPVAATAIALVLVGTTVAVATAMVSSLLLRKNAERQRARRVTEQRRHLAAALDTVVGELHVGAHPAAACAVAAGEVPGPVGAAFGVAGARGRLGAELVLDSGTVGARDDFDGEPLVVHGEFARISAAWQTATAHGVPLRELLVAVRTDVAQRCEFDAATHAALAGARATVAILVLLPLIGVGLGELMGAHPVRTLASGGLGGIVLVVGVSLCCLGALWADAIFARAVR